MGPYRPLKPPRPPLHIAVHIPEEEFKDFVRWYARETLGISLDDFSTVKLNWATNYDGTTGFIIATMWRDKEAYKNRNDE